jgi:hypothetical protein
MKAIFSKDFNYSSRKQNAGWSVKASDKPQAFPSELIDAAVAAGVATVVEPKKKSTDTETAEAS